MYNNNISVYLFVINRHSTRWQEFMFFVFCIWIRGGGGWGGRGLSYSLEYKAGWTIRKYKIWTPNHICWTFLELLYIICKCDNVMSIYTILHPNVMAAMAHPAGFCRLVEMHFRWKRQFRYKHNNLWQRFTNIDQQMNTNMPPKLWWGSAGNCEVCTNWIVMPACPIHCYHKQTILIYGGAGQQYRGAYEAHWTISVRMLYVPKYGRYGKNGGYVQCVQ